MRCVINSYNIFAIRQKELLILYWHSKWVRMMLGRIIALGRGIWRSQRGSVAIHIGLMSIVLIGMAGLGVEITLALYKHRQFQMFADTAAYSGAVALKTGTPDPSVEANAVAAELAARNNSGAVTVSVEGPPVVSGPYAGQNGIAVTVSQYQTLSMVSVVCGWFGGCTFNPALFNVGARAVAIVTASGSYCVLALSTTVSPAVKTSGTATVNLVGCNLASANTSPNSITVGGGGIDTSTTASSMPRKPTAATCSTTLTPG